MSTNSVPRPDGPPCRVKQKGGLQAVQLDYTPEIEAFYIICDVIYQTTNFNFRSKIPMDHPVLTVEVFFVVLEGEGSVVLPESDDGGDVLGVLVGEALHQHVLVGPARADLHPLQVEQLLEDAPLDLVPDDDDDWMIG